MVKVKYYDTIAPMDYEVEFETVEEACKWIEREMQDWWNLFCEHSLNAVWINRLLDCGDTTKIYIPSTNIRVSCTLIAEYIK